MKPIDAHADTDGEVADKLQSFLDVLRENDPVGWPRSLKPSIERAIHVLRNPRFSKFICECQKSPTREHNGRGGDNAGQSAYQRTTPTTQPPHQDRGEEARASFERWVRSYHEHPEQARLSYTNGCYDDEETQHKWVGYAAALAEAKQQDERWAADERPGDEYPWGDFSRKELIELLDQIADNEIAKRLAKQRGPGEAVYQFRDAYGAWRDTTKSHYDVETQHDKRTLYTAPQVEAKRQTGEGADHG